MTDPAYSIISAEERARKIREESKQREAEQAEQERRQRDRQIAHGREGVRIEEENIARMTALIDDKETRETIYARIMKLREEAKPKPEPVPVPMYTARQRKELELEMEAGRRALERHAENTRIAQEARARIGAEEKAHEDEVARKRKGHTRPVYVDKNYVPGFKV